MSVHTFEFATLFIIFMASPPIFFLLFSFFLSAAYGFLSRTSDLQNSIFLPVTKDSLTHQYVTKVHHGTRLVPTRLVVDLGGPFLWIDRSSPFISKSSSIRLIPSCSTECFKAKAASSDLRTQSCFSGKDDTPCDLLPRNGVVGAETKGEMVEDVIVFGSSDGSRVGQISTLENFLFSSAPRFLLQGLASGASGMLGLGRTQISLPAQMADVIGHSRRFTLCLSDSDGVVLFGDGSNESIFGSEISRSLTYTPFVTNTMGASGSGTGQSPDYLIGVKSIKIDGKRLSLDKLTVDERGAKLSTIVPYTTMESSIYATFIKSYMEAAVSSNMRKVDSVAPFELCFSSEGVSRTELGPAVPSIDFVLQSEMVKWRVHGRNSMVQMGDGVICLGILDSGLNPENPIVIGGFQMEENVLEFDLGTSMLGFRSLKRRSCSEFVPNSMVEFSR